MHAKLNENRTKQNKNTEIRYFSSQALRIIKEENRTLNRTCFRVYRYYQSHAVIITKAKERNNIILTAHT